MLHKALRRRWWSLWNVGLTLLEGGSAGSLLVRFGASSEASAGVWPILEFSPSTTGASRVFREIHKVPVHPDIRMFPSGCLRCIMLVLGYSLVECGFHG